jgi:hypothetical protein
LTVEEEKIHETPPPSPVSAEEALAVLTPLSSLPELGLHTDKASTRKTEPDSDSGTRDYQELLYVKLDPEYMRTISWSNDPGDLALQTYFVLSKPNLEGDFKVKGLKSVLWENEGRYKFIMTDEKDRRYVWEEDDVHLFWVKDEIWRSWSLSRKRSASSSVDSVTWRWSRCTWTIIPLRILSGFQRLGHGDRDIGSEIDSPPETLRLFHFTGEYGCRTGVRDDCRGVEDIQIH